MAPLITHENSLTKNTWITKFTIILKQGITTNDKKTYKMQAINKNQIDQMSSSSSHGKPLYKPCGQQKFTMMKTLKFFTMACHVKITKCHKIWHYTHLMKTNVQMM
jgi:hypothetical protein